MCLKVCSLDMKKGLFYNEHESIKLIETIIPTKGSILTKICLLAILSFYHKICILILCRSLTQKKLLLSIQCLVIRLIPILKLFLSNWMQDLNLYPL